MIRALKASFACSSAPGVKRSGPVTEPRCWREFRFSDSSAGCLPAQSSNEGLFIKPPLCKSSLDRCVQMITAEGYSRLNQTCSSTATNRLNKFTFSVFIFKSSCPFYIETTLCLCCGQAWAQKTLGFWKRSCFGLEYLIWRCPDFSTRRDVFDLLCLQFHSS